MDMTTCPNCQRSVPTANFDVHSARCNRVQVNNDTQLQQEPTNTPQVEEQIIDEPQQQEENSNDANDDTSNRRVSSRRSSNGINHSNSFLTRGGSNSEWDIVNAAVMSSYRNSNPLSNRQTSQSDNTDTVQLREGQWQCTRCTLINESHHLMCEACRRPRNTSSSNTNNDPAALARRNRGTTNRISNDALNGSNITYYSTMSNLSTGNRIVNGAINGAMVGSIVGGLGGLIVGGITGAASGAFIDRMRARRGEQLEDSEREMLLDRSADLPPNTMRVHRGEHFITGASTNSHGVTRVIRLRYSTGHLPGRAATDGQEQLERTFLQLLMRASFNRPTSHGSHVIIEPEVTFEDLLERFGSGLERRGASQAVIDSYPVEIVGSDGLNNGSRCDKKSSSGKADDDGVSTQKKTKNIVGTCNICLEDYQAGEAIKSLSCPHTFHKGCIDQWLRRVACCPVCKADVGMYKKPPAEEHNEETIN